MPTVKRFIRTFVILAFLASCAPAAGTLLEPQPSLISVDQSLHSDSLVQATIAPFKARMDQQMNEVIGHSAKHLETGLVESVLGNFVADVILEQGRLLYDRAIDISAITIGGLRAPLPEGPITVAAIYELMPFENILYILELEGPQIRTLFEQVAKGQRTAVSNSVVLIKGNDVHKLFIDGVPFNHNRTYTLAISDYLAEGGDHMEFLREARILARIDVKIRDMIINHIRWMTSQGQKVDAEIEGRVKILP